MLDANGVAPGLERQAARRTPAFDAREAFARLAGAAAPWLNVLLPFALFVATYEALGLLRSLVVARGVSVFWPYWFDKLMFGVGHYAGRLSLNELFSIHHWPAVDLITGLAYLLFLHAVLGFAIFLGFIDRSPAGRSRLRAFGWAFLGLNLAGFATYIAFPVAPPWYVATHGFGPADVHAVASPAALARWDALTGVPYFRLFYAQATDVFGSMPSMHCAYPMLLVLYATELKRPALISLLVAFQLLMCFSAVYLQHHYVSDVIVGTAYASLAYVAERMLTGRTLAESPPAAAAS